VSKNAVAMPQEIRDRFAYIYCH